MPKSIDILQGVDVCVCLKGEKKDHTLKLTFSSIYITWGVDVALPFSGLTLALIPRRPSTIFNSRISSGSLALIA